MTDIIDIDTFKKTLVDFARIRDWEKYHNPKNVAMALTVEASELLEIFQWMSEAESLAAKDIPEIKKNISYELADIIIYAIRMADLLNINLNEALHNKMAVNNDKYPADKVKGSARKYTQYVIDTEA
jgi:dCTP diphosphatase